MTGPAALIEKRRRNGSSSAAYLAAEELIACYSELAARRAHLLDDLLDGEHPVQWRHYPENDIVDRVSGYQYFYHSHAPGDRNAAAEHGHLHLFARLDCGDRKVAWHAERKFLQQLHARPVKAATVGLLAIALDAKGLPVELFTVNRWVTGDQLLSAATTCQLLHQFHAAAAGPPLLNRWLAAMLRLFQPQIGELLKRRDDKLIQVASTGERVLHARPREILSRMPISLDQTIAQNNAHHGW